MATAETHRPAPEPRGRGVGSRGDDGLRGRDRAGDPRCPPARRGLLPRAPPHRLPRDHRPLRAGGAGRRADRLRVPGTARRARRGGRQGSRLRARLHRPGPGNARHYAQIVKQNALLRRLLTTSQRIQKSVHDREGEPDQLVERAESLLFKVAHEERASDFRRVAEVLGDEIDRLEQLAKGDQTITGTPSGFRDLDAKLGGFQPGNLIIVAARPALGKSALVCNIAENVASKHEKPVAFFSLEMSEAELAHRFISCRSRIPNDKLRKGNVAARDWPGWCARATSSRRRRCGSTTPRT